MSNVLGGPVVGLGAAESDTLLFSACHSPTLFGASRASALGTSRSTTTVLHAFHPPLLSSSVRLSILNFHKSVAHLMCVSVSLCLTRVDFSCYTGVGVHVHTERKTCTCLPQGGQNEEENATEGV